MGVMVATSFDDGVLLVVRLDAFLLADSHKLHRHVRLSPELESPVVLLPQRMAKRPDLHHERVAADLQTHVVIIIAKSRTDSVELAPDVCLLCLEPAMRALCVCEQVKQSMFDWGAARPVQAHRHLEDGKPSACQGRLVAHLLRER